MHARIFKKLDVDLEKKPEPCTEFKPHPSNQVTIGDLHGNALKLIHFLIFNRIMTMKTRSAYSRFVKVYMKEADAITWEDIVEFNLLLANADLNPEAVKVHRNLGDVLADRGKDDYKTLKIFEKMGQCKIPFEILFSNHDAAFLAREKNENSPYLYVPFALSDTAQCNSMHTLGILISKGLVAEEEIEEIIEKYYKPNLKLLSYSIDDQHNPPIVSLYSHAAVGLETLESLAKKYNIIYRDKTVRELCNTIDKINKAFQASDMVADYRAEINTIKDRGLYNSDVIPADYPLFRIAWNRSKSDASIKVPVEQNGYLLRFIHGHEGYLGKPSQQHSELKSYADNMFNLDISLGKTKENDSHHTGTFYSLFSREKAKPPLTSLQKKPKELTPDQQLKAIAIPVVELKPDDKTLEKRKRQEENDGGLRPKWRRKL